jgi:hypothetical protein
LGVPAEQLPTPKEQFGRRRAIRCKSSLRSGLSTAIPHANVRKEERDKKQGIQPSILSLSKNIFFLTSCSVAIF